MCILSISINVNKLVFHCLKCDVRLYLLFDVRKAQGGFINLWA